MTELEINAAAERLKLETELNEKLKTLDEVADRIRKLQASLLNLKKDPAEYFRIEARIQELFKDTQQ
jgi:hypothetical protein